jgi:fumarate hydratase subunit alpha
MRTICGKEIENAVFEMFKAACICPPEEVYESFKRAMEEETSPAAREVLGQLIMNAEIATRDSVPYCQDTGMAVVFAEIGQDVHIDGGFEDAVNAGVKKAYTECYYRKSVLSALSRVNTNDNTPAVIHTRLVCGDKIKLTALPKGFGSENMSKIYMLKPADGEEGVKNAILQAVKDAGPNACPPMVIGVGIGGTFEKCAIMAKQALTRPAGEHSDIPYIKDMEEEMLERINATGIGPGGLGGSTTALAVNINTYATHIAGLPVAVNICCHVNRHISRTL